MTPILVWDIPARLFHFAFGMVTGTSVVTRMTTTIEIMKP